MCIFMDISLDTKTYSYTYTTDLYNKARKHKFAPALEWDLCENGTGHVCVCTARLVPAELARLWVPKRKGLQLWSGSCAYMAPAM